MEILNDFTKIAKIVALATVVGCGIFGCQKKTEPIIPEVSVRVEETLDNDGDTIREVESVIGKESKSYIEESSVAKEEDSKVNNYSGFDDSKIKVVDSEEAYFEMMKAEGRTEYTPELLDELSKDFVCVDLPESEWGPIYNADGSDPTMSRGGRVVAYNKYNPLGKDAYVMKGGVIVPDNGVEVLDSVTGPVQDRYYEIEAEVFKKNNPNLNYVYDISKLNKSTPRWTYVKTTDGYYPDWYEKEHLMVMQSSWGSGVYDMNTFTIRYND